MAEPLNNLNGDPADLPSPDLSVRTAPKRVSGLRRRTIRLAIALLAVIVAAALIVGLGIGFRSHAPSESRRIETPPENMQPSPIADLPSSYADMPRSHSRAVPQATATIHDMHHHDDGVPSSQGSATQKEDLTRLLASIQQVGRKNEELARQLAAYQSAAAQEQAKVWGSGLFFKMDEMSTHQAEERSKEANPVANVKDSLTATKNAVTSLPSPAPATAASQPSTDQQHKLAFLNDSPSPELGIDRTSLPPSPGVANSDGYLLQAGTVVPAALLTGINTDLPGDVVASVTEGVYDSPTGNHLLIPQGARLLGSYDSQIAASQDRALLVWHRLLLPNGHSVNLDRMRGTDAAGYAGVADRVDYHADKLASAALLSGVVAYAGNLAGGRQTLTLTPGDVVGSAVAQQASTGGSNLVQRQLNVQPTITIRPGWPVRVLVNRDILLPTYAN